MTSRDLTNLIDYMERALDQLDRERDLMDKLMGADYTMGPSVDALDLDETERDLLTEMGQNLDTDEDGEFYENLYTDNAYEAVRESYENVLSIENEKGDPFCVALSIGGPNIYLVDFGGFGGPQMWGAWGERHTITHSRVDRHVAYFREFADECDL